MNAVVGQLGARQPGSPVGPPPPPPPGPIAQSVAIGFRTMYIVGLLLVLIWLCSNVREISSDSQAVVRRFGRIVRSQEAGLLIAWPRPIEQIQLLPGPERQLSQDVATLAPPSEKFQSMMGSTGGGQALPVNAAPYLTGDDNIVLLSATLIYRISDPIAYALSESHVQPALDRLFRATTVRVTAGRDLNEFLVVESSTGSGAAGGGQTITALRGEVRSLLLQSMNARLTTLADAGASLGVEVQRIDMTAWLPPEAKSAFDEVLVATQAADRNVAMARTDAERRRQDAERERAQLVSAAQASARELASRAVVNTAPILALEHEASPDARASLLLQQYRTGVADILSRTGSVTLIDPQNGVRFVLPGKSK